MSTKFIQEGKILDYTAITAIRSDEIVTIGSLISVALEDAEVGDTIPVHVSGVWLLPKNNNAIMNQGDFVDWDASASEFIDDIVTPTAGDITDGCIVVEDAALADTEVKVLLNAGNGLLN